MRRRPQRRKKEIEIPVIKNEEIKSDEVRVLGEHGDQLGVMTLAKALEMAKVDEQDLILIAPNAKPPVCKLIYYDKYKYQVIKKRQKAKSKQKITTVKEIRLSSKISDNDFNIKQNNARKFIAEGDKVRFVLRFVGREVSHSDIGKVVIDKMISQLMDVAEVEQEVKFDKKKFSATVMPKKK